ncbi:hypothetical protein JCM6882_009702 [Rhodosporidiobolus microsporus]
MPHSSTSILDDTSQSSTITFLALLTNLSKLLLAASLCVGFNAILRRVLLREQGASISTNGLLATLSRQSLQFKLSWSALVALAVFFVVAMYPSATAAAFGASYGRKNISAPYELPLVASSLVNLLVSVTSVLRRLPPGSFLEPYLDPLSLANSWIASSPATALVVVPNGATEEPAEPGAPLFETSFLAQDTNQAVQGNLTTDQRRLVAASPTAHVFTTVEGFFADASCSTVAVPFNRNSVANGTFFQVNLDFPCGGTPTIFYSKSSSPPESSVSSIADYFVCPSNGSSPVYLYTLPSNLTTPSDQARALAFECTVSLSSALVHIDAISFRPASGSFHFNRASSIDKRNASRRPLTFPSVLARTLSSGVFRTRGMTGNEALALALERVERTNGTEVEREFVEHVVETAVKQTLAQLSTVAMCAATSGLFEARRREQERFIEVQALNLHFTPANLAWLAVPSLLLASLLLFLPLFVLTAGSIGFSTTRAAEEGDAGRARVFGACQRQDFAGSSAGGNG